MNILLINTCAAHRFQNCVSVLTGKIIFNIAKRHSAQRVLSFILMTVSLSKPKDLVIAFFVWPSAAATEACPRRHPALVSYTLSVQFSAGVSETLCYLK